MKATKKIIVPVDFLQHTENLVDFSTNIANKLDATVTFLHVIQETDLYSDYLGPTIKHLSPAMVKIAEEKMGALIKRVKHANPQYNGRVASGDVAESIVGCAEEEESDMIIIATHGRKGLEKFWLGSVAEKVLRKAPCPTLTYNPTMATDIGN